MLNKTYLSMLDIANQPMRNGSTGCASTRVVGFGQESAQLLLARSYLDYRRQRSGATNYVLEIKTLLDGKLAIALRTFLSQRSELALVLGDNDALEPLLKVLADLQSQGASPMVTEVSQKILAIVQEAIERLIAGVDRSYHDQPEQACAMIDGIRKILGEYEGKQSAGDALERLKRIAGNLNALQQRRTAVMDDTYRNAVARLKNRLRELHEKSIHALAVEYTDRTLRSELNRLESFLTELRQKGIEYQERMDGLIAALVQMRRHASEQVPHSESSVFLPLEGLNEREVLNALNRQFRCKEIVEMAKQFAPRWEQTLRKLLPVSAPHVATDASYPDLIRAFTGKQLAKAFARCFDQALGNGVSLYELLEKYGKERAVRFLLERAAPSCSPGGRAVAQFNVQLLQQTMVRLPLPMGPMDKELREQVRTVFRKLGAQQFLDTPADQPLTVLRVTVGYPIGLDNHNTSLLLAYQQAADSGHSPHLLGLLPSSNEGEACPDYCQLNRDTRSSI